MDGGLKVLVKLNFITKKSLFQFENYATKISYNVSVAGEVACPYQGILLATS